MLPETPFAEDSAICRLADDLGLTLSRYEGIDVYDESAIAAAGLMVEKPDYSAIRKALRDGGIVEGARLRGVEYILRRQA